MTPEEAAEILNMNPDPNPFEAHVAHHIRVQTDIAAEALRVQKALYSQMAWAVALLAVIAVAALVIAGFALTVPLYPA